MRARVSVVVAVVACAACGGENNEGDPAPGASAESDPVRCLRAETGRVTNFSTGSNYSDGTSISSFAYAYPNGSLVEEFTDLFHVTGTVNDFAGMGVTFGACVDASRFTAMTFDLWGDVGPTGSLTVYASTRRNSPAPPFTETGTCRPTDPAEPYRSCLDPYAQISVSGSRAPVRLNFSSFMGGIPHDSVDAGELLAFFFSFDWNQSQAAYTVDVSMSDVEFVD